MFYSTSRKTWLCNRIIQCIISQSMHIYTGATSLYKGRNLCLSVCVCVCVCLFLTYLCRSGSDLPESFNMAAAWFKGVWSQICLDYNDTVNRLLHKCFINSASIVHRSHHSHVRARANQCRAQTHDIPEETSWFIPAAAQAGPGFCRQFGPVLFCASKQTVVD